MLHRTSTSRALAGIQIYKKESVEGGRYGTRYRYHFPCPGIIVVSVDKAASSSHMHTENAINLGKKNNERALEGASNFGSLRDTTTTHRNRSLRRDSLIPPLLFHHVMQLTVPRGRTDTGCPYHHQNQHSAAPSTHPRPPRRALALPRHPSSACQEGKQTAQTSPVEVAAAWILSQPAQTIEAAALVRWRWKWNRKICPESSW